MNAVIAGLLHSAACAHGLGAERCDRSIAIAINAACPSGYVLNASFLPCRIGDNLPLRRRTELALAYEHGVDLVGDDTRGRGR